MKIVEISEAFKIDNNWSCLPCAFAHALGLPVKKIIEKIKHDGSEIIYPNEPDPKRRKSFHIQELIDVCFGLGKYVTGIDAIPNSVVDGYDPLEYRQGSVERLTCYLKENKGVLTGFSPSDQRHAVYWNGEYILDPNGYTYNATDFGIETFWLIGKRQKGSHGFE